MSEQDDVLTEGGKEEYATIRTFRMLFQLSLFFLTASFLVYGFSIFPLLDDRTNTFPQPQALMGFTQWLYAFPMTAVLIILYTQFAFTLNRRSCMSPMYWIVLVLYILVLLADLVYIMVLWFTKCKGAVDLAAHPELGYCSDGTAVRWQFHFTLWSLVAMAVFLILTAFLLQKIFSAAKEINKLLRTRKATPGVPAQSSVLENEQVGASLLPHQRFADLFVLELLSNQKKFK